MTKFDVFNSFLMIKQYTYLFSTTFMLANPVITAFANVIFILTGPSSPKICTLFSFTGSNCRSSKPSMPYWYNTFSTYFQIKTVYKKIYLLGVGCIGFEHIHLNMLQI